MNKLFDLFDAILTLIVILLGFWGLGTLAVWAVLSFISWEFVAINWVAVRIFGAILFVIGGICFTLSQLEY